MSDSTNRDPIIFDDLLSQLETQQINAVNQGQETSVLLNQENRHSLFIQLKEVQDQPNTPKLFDQTSLKQIEHFFSLMEKFQEELKDKDHSAYLLYKNPLQWFEKSHLFMYDAVNMVEFVRYFALGQTYIEKEIVFRTLVAKLIKIQATVRTIISHPQFLKSYLDKNSEFNEKIPSLAAKYLHLSKVVSPKDSVSQILQALVDEISNYALTLFSKLDIPINKNATQAIEKKNYYDALIIAIRHYGKEIFEALDNEKYVLFVEELTHLLERSLLHPNTYLFQHIKREYLTFWLVYTLREEDKKKAKTFYQSGKADIYSKFEAFHLPQESLTALKEINQLDNNEIIQAEIESTRALSEREFYDLLLKIYTHYKNDQYLMDSLPIAPQALAASGDITWEQRSIIALAEKKVIETSKENKDGKNAQANIFANMLGSLKKAQKKFFGISKNVNKVKREKAVSLQATLEKQADITKNERAHQVLKVAHKGNLLKPNFPVTSDKVKDFMKGQRQDISFNNNDRVFGEYLEEQEIIVDMFNVEDDRNNPINESYIAFANAVKVVFQCYGDSVKKVQIKVSSPQKVDTLSEELLYLDIDDNVVLALGSTYMGQHPRLGSLPDGKTAYFRLFVKGHLMKLLPKSEVAFIKKSFQFPEKVMVMTHVGHNKFLEDATYTAVLIDALITVIESLPQSEFESLDSFLQIIQNKANFLLIKNKQLSFDRAL